MHHTTVNCSPVCNASNSGNASRRITSLLDTAGESIMQKAASYIAAKNDLMQETVLTFERNSQLILFV